MTTVRLMTVVTGSRHGDGDGVRGLSAAAPSWTQLEASLTGALLLPGAAGYEAARRPARPSDFAPAAIILATDAADVATTVAFGRAHGISTVPRSGGHCFAGRSSTSGLLIDVSAMDQVAVSGRRVTVGAGARLAQIYDVLEAEGLTLPAGTWPTVGIAGHALGGGLGFLGRTHGLTSDHLVAAEIVLADGRVTWCDDVREPDLVWALRGSGGGQFGVVTTLVLDAVPAPTTASSLHLTWPYDHAAAVIAAWQTWAPQAPDELEVDLRLIAPADPGQAPVVNLFGMMLDADTRTTAVLLEDLIDHIGTNPTWVFHQQSSYLAAVRRLTGLGADRLPASAPEPVRFAKSEFFRSPLPLAAVTALTEHFAADLTPGYVRELDFTAWAGAYNRVPVDATAFAHRAESFLIELAAVVDPRSEHRHQAARDWLHDAWRITHPWGTGGVYPNFPDPDLPDGEAAYHGPNLGRLRQVKHRYDPDNWFRFPQSVTPVDRPFTDYSKEHLMTTMNPAVPDRSYATTITVDRTPREVFDAVNDVPSWWTAIDGSNHQVGDEFSYHVEGMHYCKMRVSELVPGKKIVWRVLESEMTFVDDQSEWVGTDIRFELTEQDGGTEVRFTHIGLVPEHECFDVCNKAWTHYLGDSLRSVLTTGTGKPNTNPDEAPN